MREAFVCGSTVFGYSNVGAIFFSCKGYLFLSSSLIEAFGTSELALRSFVDQESNQSNWPSLEGGQIYSFGDLLTIREILCSSSFRSPNPIMYLDW